MEEEEQCEDGVNSSEDDFMNYEVEEEMEKEKVIMREIREVT